MNAVYISSGNNYPTVRCIIKYADGTALNLTDSAVSLLICELDKTPYSAIDCTILSASGGDVSCTLDTDIEIGNYLCQYYVEYDDGRIINIPNDGYFRLIISESLEEPSA